MVEKYIQGYQAGYNDGLYGNLTIMAGMGNDWNKGYFDGHVEGAKDRIKESKKTDKKSIDEIFDKVKVALDPARE